MPRDQLVSPLLALPPVPHYEVHIGHFPELAACRVLGATGFLREHVRDVIAPESVCFNAKGVRLVYEHDLLPAAALLERRVEEAHAAVGVEVDRVLLVNAQGMERQVGTQLGFVVEHSGMPLFCPGR